MTVLLVVIDDEEVDRYLVKRVAKELETEVKVVEFDSGQRFIEVIEDESTRAKEIGENPPPFMVFLDINMPGMTGYEVLDELQKRGFDDQVLVVTMYSSSAHAADRADALHYEFVKDYIVKPITLERMQQFFESNHVM